MTVALNKNLQALFNKANQARTGGDPSLAEKLYVQILKIKLDNVAALHELGLLMIEKGQPRIACRLLQQAISLFSADSDYHFHLGEALMACGKSNDAIDYYKKALIIKPDDPDFYFGLGNAYTETRNYQAAIEAYKFSVRLNPEDFEAFNNLGNALFELGENKLSIIEYENALDICPEYAKAHLNLSASLKLERRIQASLYHAQQVVRFGSDEVDNYLNLANILFELEKFKQSQKFYFCALELDQVNQRALRGCAKTLMQTGDVFDALSYFEKALASTSADEDLVIEMTSCLIRLQEISKAKSMLEELLERSPRSELALFNYGLCLQAEGKFTAALITQKTCWKTNPRLTESAYHIACNGRYKINDNDINLMKEQLTDCNLESYKKVHLNFALAKSFEIQNDYHQAFKYYKQANCLKAQKYPFNPNWHIDYVESIKKVFNSGFFSRRSDYGLINRRLVFIVGMPRSGSTLVEQILASHPSVNTLGEHMAMPAVVKKLAQLLDCSEYFPQAAMKITSKYSLELANQYLDYIRVNNNGITTDKMLGNFLRLGLIALLFPNARIVHCQRNPMDTCVSCFTQDFAHGLRFSTNLGHLGLFYNSYKGLMQHWYENLPLNLITIQYEKLVLSKEYNVKRLLEFCGLPWDSQCLNFHETKREVSTASFWQVKQPMYTQSISRWKKFEPYLQPLAKTLKLSGQSVTSIQ